MTRYALICVLVLFGAWVVRAQETQPTTTTSRPAIRFEAVDVYLDPQGQTLAAYQFELLAPSNRASIVGIEGGDHPAFVDPPYYDPAALSHNRVVIAAFSTDPDLPTRKTRIARIHFRITGDQEVPFTIRLQVAAASDGSDLTGVGILLETGGNR